MIFSTLLCNWSICSRWGMKVGSIDKCVVFLIITVMIIIKGNSNQQTTTNNNSNSNSSVFVLIPLFRCVFTRWCATIIRGGVLGKSGRSIYECVRRSSSWYHHHHHWITWWVIWKLALGRFVRGSQSSVMVVWWRMIKCNCASSAKESDS